MASSKKKSLSNKLSTKLSTVFNEEEWVIHIRTSMEEEVDEDDFKTPVSIFCVPPALVACKVEAYVPQLFAFGPYHHWRPQLYDMERYKLAAARRTQQRLNGLKFKEIVEQFVKREYKIRCHYHKYLDLSAETLAWMMAIDASFLLEFLHARYAQQAKADALQDEQAPPKTLSKRMELQRQKMGFSMILRDTTMLENQIPLFLLRKLLAVIHSCSKDAAEEELSKMLVGFVKEVSPFKAMNNDALLLTTMDNIARRAHLVEILYYAVLPKSEEPAPQGENNVETDYNIDSEAPPTEVELGGDPGQVRKVLIWVWGVLSSINGGPVSFIKRVFLSLPIKFMVQFPWKLITALPIVSIVKLPVENFFSQLFPKSKSGEEEQSADHEEKPPLVEEITIPSVTNLVKAGVKFSPTATGDIKALAFDTKTATMFLPEITLDDNTETVLRNLVAYEASAVMGPTVFTRYTELMYGIIDTEEDVRILSDNRIVKNRMKSDGEAAELWNGMSKAVKLSKVKFLDDAILDINRYYGSRWRVQCRDFMRKYVFGSWQVLTFLAAGMMLLLTCVQAFCTVYSCSAHFTKITSLGGD